MDAVLPIDAYLRYGVLPVWLAAGLADWWCHRRSRIEATSGLRVSLLHLAQLAEVGIPLLAALCLV
ncbi:diguanylate cyclase, partial [Burkholderia gladioli]